ncbi:MAG: radical SAM protein [Deltaproteobacteria bacterium]|nr:radical SAM protein [Deltaproteobacteria bacterium]
MNILFLNPPFKGRFSRSSRSPAVTMGGTLYYPIWLAYATGVAEQAGHRCCLIDSPADDLDLDAVMVRLNGFVPDLIVLDTSTPSIYNDVAVADRMKSEFPEAFTMIVGTHPSALPEETLALSGTIDAAAVGEYDYTVRDVAATLEAGNHLTQVPGIVVREGRDFVRTPARPLIEELDDIPFVTQTYYKYLNVRNYFFAAANYPMVMIMTGRGCPFRCFFCVYPQVFHSRRYRTRSAENVVDEFAYVVDRFPEVREIGIEDDCFSGRQSHVHDVCELIIRRGIRIKWYCNVRGDLDFDTLRLMKNAGCRLVTVGFESGVQSVLDSMHKGETVDRYYRFVRDAKRAGILVHGCIMVGNPGDTRETLAEGYEFAARIDCDSMQFYPLYVYPGTEAYRWARDAGYLRTEDFSQWVTEQGLHNCVLETPDLSGKEMVSLCSHYLARYHLRPRYIAMKLMQAILHPSEGYRTLKAARGFLGKLLYEQLPGKGRRARR